MKGLFVNYILAFFLPALVGGYIYQWIGGKKTWQAFTGVIFTLLLLNNVILYFTLIYFRKLIHWDFYSNFSFTLKYTVVGIVLTLIFVHLFRIIESRALYTIGVEKNE